MPQKRNPRTRRTPRSTQRATSEQVKDRNLELVLSGRVHPSPMATLGNLGFPKKLEVVHKYVDTIQRSSTAAVPATLLMSCNGMFDPNITITGHQPLYFDQLAAIYNHYTVFASRIRITITNPTLASYVSLSVDDDTSVPTTIVDQIEQSTGTGRLAIPTPAPPTVLTQSWRAKDFFGGDIFDNDNLQGTVAANPTEQSYYSFQAVETNFITNVTYSLLIEVTYHAVWDELKTVAQS